LDTGGIEKEIIRFWTIDPKNRKVFPFKGHCYDIIAWARQLLLTRARRLDPDYAIFIDSDIFLRDPSTIDALTIWNKDVVGGAYMRMFPEGLYIATLFYNSSLKDKVKGHIKLKKLKSRVPLYEVRATSGGCLCLSRKIIQDRRVNFAPIPKNNSEDFGYCKTAIEHGYRIHLDGTTVIGHKITLKWRSWDIVRDKDGKRVEEYDSGLMIERLKKRVALQKKLKAKRDY